MDAVLPCRTLYLRNLPEKLSKPRLRKLLHAAFSPYGHICWIVAEKSRALRGQAFVTFDDLPSATTALRKMSGTQFMGRQMTVTYAKQLSDKVGSIQGDGGSRRARARKRKADRDEDVAKRVKVGEEGDVAKPGWTTPAPVS